MKRWPQIYFKLTKNCSTEWAPNVFRTDTNMTTCLQCPLACCAFLLCLPACQWLPLPLPLLVLVPLLVRVLVLAPALVLVLVQVLLVLVLILLLVLLLSLVLLLLLLQVLLLCLFKCLRVLVKFSIQKISKQI